jgi:hypothetical protein
MSGCLPVGGNEVRHILSVRALEHPPVLRRVLYQWTPLRRVWLVKAVDIARVASFCHHFYQCLALFNPINLRYGDNL